MINFFLKGPRRSTYFVKASLTVHGVGNGCLAFAFFDSGLALNTKREFRSYPRSFDTYFTSSSVFSGKIARFVAVL